MDDPQDDLAASCQPNALVLFNQVFNNGPGRWGHARVGDRRIEELLLNSMMTAQQIIELCEWSR